MQLGALKLLASRPRDALYGACLLCLRPHAIFLGAAPGGTNTIPAAVRSVQWQGDLHAIELEAAGQIIRLVCLPLHEPPLPGTAVQLSFQPDDATLIPADV